MQLKKRWTSWPWVFSCISCILTLLINKIEFRQPSGFPSYVCASSVALRSCCVQSECMAHTGATFHSLHPLSSLAPLDTEVQIVDTCWAVMKQQLTVILGPVCWVMCVVWPDWRRRASVVTRLCHLVRFSLYFFFSAAALINYFFHSVAARCRGSGPKRALYMFNVVSWYVWCKTISALLPKLEEWLIHLHNFTVTRCTRIRSSQNFLTMLYCIPVIYSVIFRNAL